MWPFTKQAVALPRIEPAARKKVGIRLTGDMMESFAADEAPVVWRAPQFRSRRDIFKLPQPLPGVVPAGLALDASPLAQDYGLPGGGYSQLTGFGYGAGLGFVGYPYLAELAQRLEYRRGSEIIAKEMTRKGIEIKSVGKGDKDARIKELKDAFDNFRCMDVLRTCAEHDGFYGVGYIYADTGDTENPAELQKPMPLLPEKIKKGSLIGFRNVDPLWTYPNVWESANPLRANFYKPDAYYVMGNLVHKDRFWKFVAREVPDLLKPAYQFGGISYTQLGSDYVNDFLQTRASIAQLIKSFSTMVLMTTMDVLIQPGSLQALIGRLQMFVQGRDNRGVFAVDKTTEDMKNVTTPLGTLDVLQAQSQGRMPTVWKIPIVVWFGTTPSGLNASTDNEVRVFYDWIASLQEIMNPIVRNMLDLIQLSLWNEIDPDIIHEWVPLWQLTEAEQAAVNKTEAETSEILVNVGAIDEQEVRDKIAAEAKSGYNGLKGEAPGPPADPMADDPSEAGGADPEGKSDRDSGV